jgi:hypothetical protein
MYERSHQLALALLLASAWTAVAPGPGTAGSVTSSACGSASTCSANSSSYVKRALTYTPSTGLFTGTLTTNGATVLHTLLLPLVGCCCVQTATLGVSDSPFASDAPPFQAAPAR